MKLFLIILSFLILAGCAEEDVEEEEVSTSEASTNAEFSITAQFITTKSNLVGLSSLISNPNSTFTANSVTESNNGYVQGVTSNDQIKKIFDDHIGDVTIVKKNEDKFLYKGDFQVTTISGDIYNCLLIFEKSGSSSCLIKSHDDLDSFSFNFYKENTNDVALILVGMSDQRKVLYEYDLDTKFFKVEEFNGNGTTVIQNGEVINSYGSNDSISFLIQDESEKRVILFKKIGGVYHIKNEVVSSPSVMDVSGDYYYMSKGRLRGEWDKSIYYKTSSNNRTISKKNNLVSYKDGFFPLFYQDDYEEFGYPKPSILYFRPKRDDLPDSYPSYTFEEIKCCFTKNSPDGLHLEMGEMGWTKVLGYKSYALAYGESIGTNYNGYQDGDIIVQKALILIDSNKKTFVDGKNPFSSKIYLYDFDNTSSPEENKLNELGLDSVTSIENYINGFKISGLRTGDQKAIFYNPYTNAIETPSTNDKQSFIIKERL